MKTVEIEKEVFDTIIEQAFRQMDLCMRGLYDCKKCQFLNETEGRKYICKRMLVIDMLEKVDNLKINLT